MRRLLTVLSITGFALGCSNPDVEEDAIVGDDEAALTAARSEFDDILSEVSRLKEKCDSTKKCKASGGLHPAALQTLAGSVDMSTDKKLADIELCDAIRPFAFLETPYFFVGESMKAAEGITIAGGGIDLVFDLRNQQAALFRYSQSGLQNLVGIEAAAYMGYGFGKKNNVLDAWSGEFKSAESTIGLPFLRLSAGGAIFRSPDDSVWGGAVELSAGLNLLPSPIDLELAASNGWWTPWDAATREVGNSYFLVDYSEKKAEAVGASHTYLQFKGSKDIALALVESLGPFGVLPAAQTTALAVLHKKGLTIERACPVSK